MFAEFKSGKNFARTALDFEIVSIFNAFSSDVRIWTSNFDANCIQLKSTNIRKSICSKTNVRLGFSDHEKP